MSLPDLLKEAIASGRLTEPFTSRQVVQVLANPAWSIDRVRSFLARHCQGNLAASYCFFERLDFGQYRLLRETVRDLSRPAEYFPKC